MAAFLPLLALLVIATVSLLVIHVGARALGMTGLSKDAAWFQAFSSFFGVGFTTKEAELVVNHPARRRIILHLMLLGNVGLTGALGALVVTFVRAEAVGQAFNVFGIIVGSLFILYLISRWSWARRLLDHLITMTLARAGAVGVADYALLLRVRSGYCISQVDIHEGHWLVGKTLAEARLGSHGVVVLGIDHADGRYVGTPDGSSLFATDDSLTVYGRESDIIKLRKNPPPSKP